MTETASAALEGLKDRHRQEAFQVIRQLESALLDAAGDGVIPVATLRQAVATLGRQPDLFDPAYGLVATEFQAQIRRHEFAAIRQDSFGRLLVSRFAHLLEGREAGSLADGALSRGMLVPFFKAVRMMVGAEPLETIRVEIDELVATLYQNGTPLDDPEFWLALGENPRARKLVLRLFVTMGLCFEDYQRRKRWFIDLINDNMPRPPAGSARADWRFDAHHFTCLMRALLRDVREAMLTPEGLAQLTANFGGDTVERLRDLLAALDRDSAAQQNSDAAGALALLRGGEDGEKRG